MVCFKSFIQKMAWFLLVVAADGEKANTDRLYFTGTSSAVGGEYQCRDHPHSVS